MPNIITPKTLKLFLKIFVLFGLLVQMAYLFFAFRDLPFMLSFPNALQKNTQYTEYAPHFDYYVRQDRHSPFLIMQERYMGLARSGMIYARQNSHYTASKQTLDDVIHYYKKILKDTPQNGHAAFLLAEAYFLKFDYAQSTKYLMQSYQFYPISGRLAKARHRLSFRLLSYFPEDVSAYRDQDYKIIQMLNKGAQ